MGRPGRDGSDRWYRRTDVIVAIIGLVGVAITSGVTLATTGNNSTSPEPALSAAPTTSPITGAPAGPAPIADAGKSSAIVQVTSWTREEVDPPPGVRYTFKGTATGMLNTDEVLIVRRRETPKEEPLGLPDGKTETVRFDVAPDAAAIDEDGTWTATWEMEQEPAREEFQALIFGSHGAAGAADPDPRSVRAYGSKADDVWASTEVTTDSLATP